MRRAVRALLEGLDEELEATASEDGRERCAGDEIPTPRGLGREERAELLQDGPPEARILLRGPASMVREEEPERPPSPARVAQIAEDRFRPGAIPRGGAHARRYVAAVALGRR